MFFNFTQGGKRYRWRSILDAIVQVQSERAKVGSPHRARLVSVANHVSSREPATRDKLLAAYPGCTCTKVVEASTTLQACAQDEDMMLGATTNCDVE